MPPRLYPASPLLGVATAVWRGDKVLLVRRSIAPNEGTWAMPGGLVEVGEKLEHAARREVIEETGLVINDPVFNDFTEIILRDSADAVERHFVLFLFVAQSEKGMAVAGDDAAAVAWITLEEMTLLPLTKDTERFIRQSRTILDRASASK